MACGSVHHAVLRRLYHVSEIVGRHHCRSALLHHAGGILPALVGLYAVATNLLFIPLMQQLWSLTLRFAPVHYLNNSNASDIFVSPAIILCLVVIALLTAFWALYEFSVLLHGLELARSGRPV